MSGSKRAIQSAALAALVAIGAALAPGASLASPVPYTLQSGTMSFNLNEGANTLASVSLALDNGFADFDTAPVSLPDFLFESTAQITVPSLPGPAGPGIWGWDWLEVSLAFTPGAGYTSSGIGSNPFDLTGGPVDLTGTVTIWKGILSKTATLSLPGFLGTAELIGGELVLDLAQMSLGTFVLEDWGGNSRTIDLVADVHFVGVPEPGTGVLLGLGVLLLAGTRRRRE